ncbi:hypothetical protein [Halobellus limi]|uniref:hypothetical protein n=1 Tax=Halobellus limi TaxID=699433 RepID=UPI0010A597A8|nr:hypothetical protein [Halobellus limi]
MKVNVPFADEEVSTDNPTNAVVTVGLIIIGFVIFHLASSIGENLAGRVNSAIGEFIGTNPATGDSGTGGV